MKICQRFCNNRYADNADRVQLKSISKTVRYVLNIFVQGVKLAGARLGSHIHIH